MIKVHISLSNGETAIYSFALTEGMQLSIGRDASCDISLPSESYMSRVHCIISYTNGQLVIQDNQSSNGIFLGNQRIVSDFLVMGQAYRFGSCTMVVSEEEASEEVQTPYEPSSAPYAQQPAYPTSAPAYPQAYPQTQGYVQPQSYPQAAYPQPTAYPQQPSVAPQPEAYPQAYPQPTAYPQPSAAPQPGAYPQAYPQPTAYPQQPSVAPQPEAYPQAYPQPTAYPQQPGVAPQPEAYPQAYPQPTAYPQPSAAPQPEAYPQAYPQPTAYPQPEPAPQPEAYPQAYPQPTAYPQPSAAPQPEAYPQAYPHPAAYPQPSAAPQPEAYPQAYPQPAAYPQPEPAPQPEAHPQAYPQTEALPPQQPVIQVPVSPPTDALPQSQSEPPPDTSAPEEPPAEPSVSVEDMLVSELVQDVDRKEENESMWGNLISQGKRKLGEWTSGLKKNRKPASPNVTDNLTSPAAQTESVADNTPAPDARPVPTASPRVGEVPGKPAAVGVDNGKVVARKRGGRSATPEAQVVGLPGSILGLPVDFELRFRVTSPSPRFEQDSLLRFCVRTKQDCRVYMVSHSCDGNAEIIIPGEKNTDNLVFTSVEAKFPGVGHEEYNMVVEPPFGAECVVLIAVGTTAKCDFIKELREKVKQKNADLSPGVPEKEAIQAFISKHSKQKDIPWSSAVLNFSTVPKQ